MYKIYADNTLIFDSSLDDYRIAKGVIDLEINKSGTFTFSVYPDHFYYDSFVKLKTIIKVTRSDKIIFRGRVINDVVDYFNNKVITCEGELSFLLDSIMRPYDFADTVYNYIHMIIDFHNSEVDSFKQFNVGTISEDLMSNMIYRSNSSYDNSLNNLNSRLLDSTLGGYLFVTHGTNGTEETPTFNYLSDFDHISPQTVEFGKNLKNYTKTIKADDLGTYLIPLGGEIDAETHERLTIKDVNNNCDYVFNANAAALYGKVFKVKIWDDVTVAENLLTKANAFLAQMINQAITIELNAVDLHLLDSDTESFSIGDYIHVISEPHNFNSIMLCKKQTIDLLKPDNDTLTLGYTYSSFTESSNQTSSAVSSIPDIQSSVTSIANQIAAVATSANQALIKANEAKVTAEAASEDVESLSSTVSTNTTNINTNTTNIASNTSAISTLNTAVSDLSDSVESIEGDIVAINTIIANDLTTPLTEKNTSISDMITRIEALEAASTT